MLTMGTYAMMMQTLDLGAGITRFYRREKLIEALLDAQG